jgi:ribosome-binding factor A
MKTERVNRLNSLMQEQLGLIIKNECEFKVHAIVSVLAVDTAKDLSQSRVSVSIYTTAETDQELVFQDLINQSKHLRYVLANTMEIRKVPRLVFVRDDSIQAESHLLDLIAKVNK